MRLTACMTAMALSLGATAALAADDFVLPTAMDDIEKFRNVSGWTVYQDKTSGTCFFSKETEDKNALVQMGLTKDTALGYIGLFAKGAGEGAGMKDIALTINDNLYVGTSKQVAKTANGYHGGYIIGLSENLRKDLNNGKELVAFPEAPFRYIISLDGVSNAIFETRKCMEDLAG